jgi:RNA polymerase sigma factor (sigma-70 family)
MTRQESRDRALATLMQAAQAGDAAAYDRLLREITPLLRQVVRRNRRFLSRDDIEDIVQDVLLSLHAVRATYDPRRQFLPWLITIARNRVVDAGRRYMRSSAHEVPIDEGPVTFSEEEANLEETYGDPEALKQAIEGLPSGQREAIKMLKLRELSLKEAAAFTGQSIGALRVSVHRGMTALRKTLTKE